MALALACAGVMLCDGCSPRQVEHAVSFRRGASHNGQNGQPSGRHLAGPTADSQLWLALEQAKCDSSVNEPGMYQQGRRLRRCTRWAGGWVGWGARGVWAWAWGGWLSSSRGRRVPWPLRTGPGQLSPGCAPDGCSRHLPRSLPAARGASGLRFLLWPGLWLWWRSCSTVQ